MQFSYDGTAYPILFGRGIALAARGRFELRALSEAEAGECWFINDEAGEYWFRIRNLDNNEELFITRTLLGTATFSPR